MSSRIVSILPLHRSWKLPAVITFLLAPLVMAQAPERPKFQTATIKLEVGETRIFGCHGTDSTTAAPSVPIGRCLGVASLNGLIGEAYDIPAVAQPEWIAGGPSWRSIDAYTIDAKSGNPTTRHQLDEMLRTLLHDQFKFAFHREPRPVPGFALVAGKNGAKLTPATGEESNSGLRKQTKHASDLGGMQTSYIGVNVPISDLTTELSATLGRPVADESGLKGNYNFTIPFFSKPDNNDPYDASIFTVLKELGLRLKPEKVPVDVLVIDHVEKVNVDRSPR